MTERRIVITGLGLVSPVGNTVQAAWENARQGRSGLTSVYENALSYVAGVVRDFDPVQIFGSREARRIDPVAQFALAAADQALKDSGLHMDGENPYDIGCIIGSCIGGVKSLVEAVQAFAERGFRGVSPLAIPRLLGDSCASRVSMEYNLRGPNYSINSACATGNNAIGDAADMIRLGRSTMMLAGSSEAALVGMAIAGFSNMKALSQYSGDPEKASRPFDLHRDGFVASEGAAILVLEELSHAQARGAHIYGEITGYGHTSDAYHITAPREDGEGAVQAIRLALQEANLQPEDIDYINAHGSSTPLNDKSETLAIKKAFGEQAYNIPVSSTKSVTGHMLGAAGAIEAIFSLLAIRDKFIPPTINLHTPDPECDLDYTPNTGRERLINHVLSNSFGFGGHNTVLVFSRYSA